MALIKDMADILTDTFVPICASLGFAMPDVLYLVSDSDLIEAARWAAETLPDLMDSAELLSGERPVKSWDHYTDSVGGVVSEKRPVQARSVE